MNHRPTIKDVAALAGVHHTTVSLALRNHPSIPEATRARIRVAAEKVRYRPDPMLASLMHYRRSQQSRQRQSVIAWVTNFPTRSRWRQTRVFQELHAGASARAERLGFKLEEFWLRDQGMSLARAQQILRARAISTLLLAPQPEPDGELALDWSDFSAVTLGFTLARPRLHLVSNHQFASMTILLQRLHALGYNRIGLALPLRLDQRVHHGWLGSYLAGQIPLPRTRRPAPWLFDEFSNAGLKTWLRRARPDVVITPTERIWDAIPKLGYDVPGDIGLAHPSVPAPDDGRTGIDENSRAIGAAALDLLSALWQHNERGIPREPHSLLIEGRWVAGRTVRTDSQM